MPGFSENPQSKNSGEKPEKPDKAKLDDDTINDVPESVKEEKEWLEVQRYLKSKREEKQKKLDEEFGEGEYITGEITLEGLRNYVDIEIDKSGDEHKLRINDVWCKTFIPAFEKDADPEFISTVEQVLNNSLYNHRVQSGDISSDFQDTVADINRSNFKRAGGFYVNPLVGDAKGPGSTTIYFNQKLLDWVTPSEEAVEAHAGESDTAVVHFKSGSGESGYDDATGFGEDAYQGLVYDHLLENDSYGDKYDINNLKRRGYNISLNSVPGIMTKVQIKKNEDGVRIGPFEDEVLDVLAVDEADKQDGYLKIPGESGILPRRYSVKKLHEKLQDGDEAYISMPIQNITPEITDGVISFDRSDEFQIARKVAVPEVGKMAAYNSQMEQMDTESLSVPDKSFEEYLQRKYEKAIRTGRRINIKKLEEKYDQNFEYTEDDVRAGYEHIIENRLGEVVESILIIIENCAKDIEFLLEKTGIIPGKELVLKMYEVAEEKTAEWNREHTDDCWPTMHVFKSMRYSFIETTGVWPTNLDPDPLEREKDSYEEDMSEWDKRRLDERVEELEEIKKNCRNT
jgi:hypothetical protein